MRESTREKEKNNMHDYEKLAVFQLSTFMSTTYGTSPDASLRVGETDWNLLNEHIRKYPPALLPAITDLKINKLVSKPNGVLVPSQIEVTVGVTKRWVVAIMDIHKIF